MIGLSMGIGSVVLSCSKKSRLFSSNPQTLALMADPPTIIVPDPQFGAVDGASPGPGYEDMTVSYRHAAGTLTDVALCEGGGSATFFDDYRRFPVTTRGDSNGNVTTTEDATGWRVTTVANAQRIAFRVLSSSGNDAYRFIVDGHYVDRDHMVAGADGGRVFIVLDFGTKAERTITIESFAAWAIDGIHVAAGDTLTKPATKQLRGIVLGDSFTTGTGATHQDDGYVTVASDYLGAELWASGVGGTGYVNTQSGTLFALPTRVAADLDRCIAFGSVDVVVVAMGINDLGMPGIEDAASTCFDIIRQKLPDALVFVVGSWNPTAPSTDADYAAAKSAIQAAMGSRGGFWFLDPESVEYTKADTTHPDNSGHRTLGAWLAEQIDAAL